MKSRIGLSLVVALASLGLGGCEQFETPFTPASEKFSLAFPLPKPVQSSVDSLRSSLPEHSQDRKDFETQFAARLQARAMRCSAGVHIGRFTTTNGVRALQVDRDCLEVQDAQLLQYLSLRRVGVLLEMGPLRPLKPLGPPGPMGMLGSQVQRLFAATDAGVALELSNSGRLFSIEIPSGRNISQLQFPRGGMDRAQVSANGRVAAVQATGGALLFLSMENGEVLWDTATLTRFFVWLPDLPAALYWNERVGASVLLDFRLGESAPYGASPEGLGWAIPLAKANSRMLIGSLAPSWKFSIVEHHRGAKGIEWTRVQTLEPKPITPLLFDYPTLMRSGKTLLFNANRALLRLDLDTGAQRLIGQGEYFTPWFVKLNETELILNTRPALDMTVDHWVLDLERETLAPADLQSGQKYQALSLADRSGFVQGGNIAWMGDAVKQGAPQPVQAVLRSFGAASESAAALVPEAVLAQLVSDAAIEGVGVYSAVIPARQGSDQKRSSIGPVTVVVRPARSPIVLVLASYESVNWQVRIEPGAQLRAVILSGGQASTVFGAGSVRIHQLGRNYAYQRGSSEFSALERDLKRDTGRGFDSFQGRNQASVFLVGGK